MQQFWEQYLNTLPPHERPAKNAFTAWAFGDSAEMADDLGQLVLQGTKTATASLYWIYAEEKEDLPEVGEYNVILDGSNQPLCITQTTEVVILPFDRVDEKFAYDEGEGDRSLSFWRRVHWEFFKRACEEINRQPEEDMPVVLERFKLRGLCT